MKILSKINPVRNRLMMITGCILLAAGSYAQDAEKPEEAPAAKKTYVNGTFASNLIIDNQTVMVPVKKTFEFTIQHRFGIVNNGYADMYGIFAPANIRLGWNYTPIQNLQFGIGACKDKMQWDGNVKYAFLRQSAKGGSPVSITYYGDMAISTIPKKGNFVNDADRISYFSQIIIARKITKKFSAQVSPSLSYFNNIAGYMASDGTIQPRMNNAHLAIAFMGRYKLTEGMSFMLNYDQPLTQHTTDNPHPNVSFGLEMNTIAHTFQMFFGSYQGIIPQQNNVFNQNDISKGQFMFGFNISRRWYHDSED